MHISILLLWVVLYVKHEFPQPLWLLEIPYSRAGGAIGSDGKLSLQEVNPEGCVIVTNTNNV